MINGLTIEQEQNLLKNVGHHTHNKINLTDKELILYALMEILDFECYIYGDGCNQGLTEAGIKKILIENKAIVSHLPVTTYLGVLAGRFEFLNEEVEE